MINILTTTTALLFLSLALAPVFAQGEASELEDLNQEFEELYRAGKYDQAVSCGLYTYSVVQTAPTMWAARRMLTFVFTRTMKVELLHSLGAIAPLH